MESRMIGFSIQGELITRIAREQFHYEGRWKYANELLEGSLCSDQITDEQRSGMVIAILDGRAELHGIYPGEDYGFRYLDAQDKAWSIERTIARMKERKECAEEELRELRTKFAFVCENYLSNYDIRNAQRRYREEFDDVLFDDIAEESLTGSSLLDSFLKRATDTEEHSTEDYGWLEPNGIFHAVEWGEHQTWAHEYMEEHLTEEDWLEGETNKAGDYLTDRGWVLLHNPSQGIAFPTKNPEKRYTKAQRDFLYGYYIERDCHKEANEIMQEE